MKYLSAWNKLECFKDILSIEMCTTRSKIFLKFAISNSKCLGNPKVLKIYLESKNGLDDAMRFYIRIITQYLVDTYTRYGNKNYTILC